LFVSRKEGDTGFMETDHIYDLDTQFSAKQQAAYFIPSLES